MVISGAPTPTNTRTSSDRLITSEVSSRSSTRTATSSTTHPTASSPPRSRTPDPSDPYPRHGLAHRDVDGGKVTTGPEKPYESTPPSPIFETRNEYGRRRTEYP